MLRLAQRLGVSRTTVSNAYSRPEKLSADLRERIFATARELGYEGPSPLAASLRTGRTDTLGVLFTDDLGYAFTDPVSSQFLAGLAEHAQEASYAITVVSVPRGSGSNPMAKAMVDGLVIYSVDEDSPGLDAARKRGIPAVLVDQEPQAGVPSVNIDDRAGATTAIGHLADLGHQRIGAITVAAGPTETTEVSPYAASASYVVRERMAGWRAGAERAAIPMPTTISCPANDRGHARQAIRILLEQAPSTTGIVCLTDELALGAIAELEALGHDVPRDLSVVGFDDSAAVAVSKPALTTIRQPARAKGAHAATLLIDQLRTGVAGTSHVLQTELVVRDSTEAPR